MLFSGDVQPNPGPFSSSVSDNASSVSSNMSTSIFNSKSFNHYLSFVHYNIQSISSKLELLHAELFHFDILAFTKTWINPSVDTDDLMLQSYNRPERKDRVDDNHSGVMLYVKETILYKRRADLEIFYRPPNSDTNYFSNIEGSLA